MSKRSLQLASDVRAMVAPVLRECPPACGIVTITDVIVSEDYGYATVFISVLRDPDAALAFLERERRNLQRRLGSLGTRRTPHLRFRYDDRSERAQRIDALLEK